MKISHILMPAALFNVDPSFIASWAEQPSGPSITLGDLTFSNHGTNDGSAPGCEYPAERKSGSCNCFPVVWSGALFLQVSLGPRHERRAAHRRRQASARLTRELQIKRWPSFWIIREIGYGNDEREQMVIFAPFLSSI